MATIQPESLSPFGRLAVKLDGVFSELSRLSGQIERLEIASDNGLDQGIKILNQFAKHAATINDDILDFSKSLQEARDRSEAAAKLMADRALLIQQRKEHQDQIAAKLNEVEQQVKTASAHLAGFKKPAKGEFSDADKREIAAEFERLSSDLVKLIADAQAIRAEAAESKFKSIERQAASMIEILQSSRRRLDKATAAK